MLARIAWMAVLLYGGAASPLASPTSNIRPFAHQCDLCQLVPLGARVRLHRGRASERRSKSHHSHAPCRQARRPR